MRESGIKISTFCGPVFAKKFANAVDGFRFHTKDHLDRYSPNELIVTACENVRLAGYVRYYIAEPDSIFLNVVEVHPDYRGRKLYVPLLEAVFGKAAELGMRLAVSNYTKAGHKYIHPEIARLKKRFPDIPVREHGY